MASRICRICFVTDRQRAKGRHALHRGNLPAEPTPIPEGWINTVPLRHDGLSRRRGVRCREKKCRASRGPVVFERQTSWADRPLGFRWRIGGYWGWGYFAAATLSRGKTTIAGRKSEYRLGQSGNGRVDPVPARALPPKNCLASFTQSQMCPWHFLVFKVTNRRRRVTYAGKYEGARRWRSKKRVVFTRGDWCSPKYVRGSHHPGSSRTTASQIPPPWP